MTLEVENQDLVSLITEGRLRLEWEPDGETFPPSREAFLAWADSVDRFWLRSAGPYTRVEAHTRTEWDIQCYMDDGDYDVWTAKDFAWSAEGPGD